MEVSSWKNWKREDGVHRCCSRERKRHAEEETVNGLE
jgi:hypothetical protein